MLVHLSNLFRLASASSLSCKINNNNINCAHNSFKYSFMLPHILEPHKSEMHAHTHYIADTNT